MFCNIICKHQLVKLTEDTAVLTTKFQLLDWCTNGRSVHQ